MKSERFTPAWDICDYYSAVLRMLSGDVKTALQALNQGFELRIQYGLYRSAHRINLAQVQLKILLGEHWFESERELLIAFANRRIHDNQGIARIASALALWRVGESRKVIAFLGEFSAEDEIDAGYREFLLSAACHEIGFDEEALRHYDAAWNNIPRRVYLPAVLFNGTAADIRQRSKTQDDEHPGASPEFRNRLNAWRRAMYKNTVSDGQSGRQSLTAHESEVVECVERGMSNKEIAAHLYISENTVKTTLKHVFVKLGISSRRELQ